MGLSFRRPQSQYIRICRTPPGPHSWVRCRQKRLPLKRRPSYGAVLCCISGYSAVQWNAVGLCGLLKESPTARQFINNLFKTLLQVKFFCVKISNVEQGILNVKGKKLQNSVFAIQLKRTNFRSKA